jgi:2-dehydropantoate 2-reductase
VSIAIFGVGGAGGYFGARLAQAGHDTVFLARGAHLEAIRERGLEVVTDTGSFVVRPRVATDDPKEAGKPSVVILGVKAWQVEDAARAMRPMIGRHTFVVSLQNGVEAPARLASVLGGTRVVGGLCGTISRIDGPGRIRSVGGTNFVRFGELDGGVRARTRRLRQTFADAGVSAEIPPDIHVALWQKFLFVVPVGGVGAFATATIGELRTKPELRALLEGAMREIDALARVRGIALPENAVDAALSFVDGLAAEGTSSLQRDLAAGVPSELDDWTGAVVRLARESGVPTPVHDRLYSELKPKDDAARARRAKA